MPGLFSWFNPAANDSIQSDAFGRAVLRSDRYRIVGMLCLCGVFALIDIAEAITHPPELHRYLIFLSWWSILAVYETALLVVTIISQRQGRPVRSWIWILNTIIECLLPSLGILGLTADKTYLGPFRALVSSSVGIYYLFIILSTLRLSPMLSIVAGSVCGAGYTAVYLFTLWVAPRNDYRNFMPQRNLVLNPILLFGAGLLAAAVAHQIRRHVIAALAEAETRRKLDRIEYDLNIARSIQMGLLPKQPPSVEGYDIAGWSQPAEQTGGDYYDWLELPGGKILFTIADATGHGIGPALLVAACRAYFRAIAVHEDPLEKIAQQVNALIAVDVPDGRFITAAIALLDPSAHRLSLYSAGHAPLYHYSAATKQVTSFEADQPPLGCWPKEGEPLSIARVIPLLPGDSLVLVTDGFFECSNGEGKMLGMSPLAEFIRGNQAQPAQRLIADMHQHVLEFSRGQPQADDLTAVVIKRL